MSDADLIVVDREGAVRWLHHRAFDPPRGDERPALRASLADRRPVVSGPESFDGRIEP